MGHFLVHFLGYSLSARLGQIWVRSHDNKNAVDYLCRKVKKSPEIVRFQDFSGGDKRDRTADLMTASCYRFAIWSVFTSNTSVLSTKSAGFCKVLSIASTRFRAHLGHNLGQGSWANSGGIPNGADMDCSLSFADSQVMKEKKSSHA